MRPMLKINFDFVSDLIIESKMLLFSLIFFLFLLLPVCKYESVHVAVVILQTFRFVTF